MSALFVIDYYHFFLFQFSLSLINILIFILFNSFFSIQSIFIQYILISIRFSSFYFSFFPFHNNEFLLISLRHSCCHNNNNNHNMFVVRSYSSIPSSSSSSNDNNKHRHNKKQNEFFWNIYRQDKFAWIKVMGKKRVCIIGSGNW